MCFSYLPSLSFSLDDSPSVSPSSLSTRLGVSRRSGDSPSSPHQATPSPTEPYHQQSIGGGQSPRSLETSPTSASSEGEAPHSGRRRRDRNLDMAQVHTLVQSPIAASSTLAAPPSTNSALPPLSGSFPSVTPTNSSSGGFIAKNVTVSNPPPDVPFVELGESDLEQSNASMSGDHYGASTGTAGVLGSSMDADKARLAEVNRMIKSYESQLPKANNANLSTSNTSIDSHGQPTDEEEEDEYADDFADAPHGSSGQVDESIEVEEELSIEASKAEDSLDAEYFHSSASTGGGRLSHPSGLGSNLRHSQPLSSPEQSYESGEYNEYAGGEADDIYSQDASVNEPLENQYDYTEDAIPT